MSHYDYEKSKEIAARDYPFYALIMAAMRQADDINLAILKRNYECVWTELRERYNTPRGFLVAEFEEMAEKFKKGSHVAYIPNHVDGDDLNHRDVEFGFVTDINVGRGLVLCRYFRKTEPKNYLRTVANGEWTPIENLRLFDFIDQHVIDRFVELIEDDELNSENCFYEVETGNTEDQDEPGVSAA